MKFTNSKGVVYYLHSKNIIFGRGKLKVTNYFFSKEKCEDVPIPMGRKPIEGKNNIPMLRKI